MNRKRRRRRRRNILLAGAAISGLTALGLARKSGRKSTKSGTLASKQSSVSFTPDSPVAKRSSSRSTGSRAYKSSMTKYNRDLFLDGRSIDEVRKQLRARKKAEKKAKKSSETYDRSRKYQRDQLKKRSRDFRKTRELDFRKNNNYYASSPSRQKSIKSKIIRRRRINYLKNSKINNLKEYQSNVKKKRLDSKKNLKTSSTIVNRLKYLSSLNPEEFSYLTNRQPLLLEPPLTQLARKRRSR